MPERVRGIVTRPFPAAVLLLLVYVGLSFLNDPGGTLSTDTGAKAATLQVMSDRGHLDPDVGYWAEKWDPTGELHPLFQTSHLGTRWVAATTFPALFAELPLYDVGGYRAALLVPMLGGVAAALAARALARRLGSDRPWIAFWLVGLASPITIYSLDLWEHSIGVALLLWATVTVWDSVAGRSRLDRPLVAGLLIGLAFTMRTEALAYGAILGLVMVAMIIVQTGFVAAVKSGAALAVGAAVAALANLGLEEAATGTNIRLARASGEARTTGSTSSLLPGGRLKDPLTTTLNLEPSFTGASWFVGGVLLALLALLTVEALRPRPRERVLVVLGGAATVLYVVRFSEGFGFVPGLFAAAPLAAAGAVATVRGSTPRLPGVVALASLPLVWATLTIGGALPQWAGRYQLTTGLLLVIVGAGVVARMPKPAAIVFVALSVAVTAFGVGWLHQRSHDVADSARILRARPEPVLVTDLAFLPREMWKNYPAQKQLVAIDAASLAKAAGVVTSAGFDSFAFVTVDEDPVRRPTIDGWTRSGESTVPYIGGIQLLVATYRHT